MFAQHSIKGLRVIAFVLIAVLLMFADHRQQQMQTVRYALSWIVWPIQFIVDQTFQFTQALGNRLQTRQTLLHENEQLRAKQFLLEFQLQRLASLESENQRLQKLLGATPIDNQGAQAAEILHVDTTPFSQQIILNKGTYDGVYEGQPVVDAKGVIGQVMEVRPTSSVVLLISDITHALPIQNNRDNTRGIAVGTGSAHELELNYVPNSANFKEGDYLVTSGLGDRFPSGYPVGTITEIDINPGEAFMRVKVKPSAELDKIREVLLITESSLPATRYQIADEDDEELNLDFSYIN